MFLARGEPVELQGLRLLGLAVGVEFLAYGIAAEYYLFCREEAFHPFIGHAYALDLLCEHLVGKPCEAVLLLDERGNSLRGSLPEQGGAGESAHADCYVRFEFIYQAPGHPLALEHKEGDLDVVDYVLQVQLALQAAYGKAGNLVSGRRDLLHFHLPLRAYEEDFGLGIEFLEFVRDADGGEDVPSRAASADYGSYLLIFHLLVRSFLLQCSRSRNRPGRRGRVRWGSSRYGQPADRHCGFPFLYAWMLSC